MSLDAPLKLYVVFTHVHEFRHVFISDSFLPVHIFRYIFWVCVVWEEFFFRVDEKCGRKYITILQNQLKVWCLFVYVASVLTILTELRASVRFAEHVIDAERYCRWCITYAHEFRSRTWIRALHTSPYRIVQTPHTHMYYYITSTLLFLLLILDFVRFCISHFIADGRRSALRKIAKMYLFLLYYWRKKEIKINTHMERTPILLWI